MSNMVVPKRSEIDSRDKWDLSSLYKSDQEWEEAFVETRTLLERADAFSGRIGDSADTLLEALKFSSEVQLALERLLTYANLRTTEDLGCSDAQSMLSRGMALASELSAALSYMEPQIMAIDDEKMAGYLRAPQLDEYTIVLNKLIRLKPFTLSEGEERILALQKESNQTASNAFDALMDVDLDCGAIETKDGEMPLTASSLSVFLIDPDRAIREKAYRQYYREIERHKNTLSALYSGSISLDIHLCKSRRFSSSREMALFPDNVPVTVYDNLLKVVGEALPKLHHYYEVRRRRLDVERLAHYDVYVPLAKDLEISYTYDEAVDVIDRALLPLGDEYREILKKGLLGTWVDRYENEGKRAGAFSCCSYGSEPYILMNYKEKGVKSLFTLAHEAGHSMHSWYSTRNNPLQHYDYTIFEAEVASTFNEILLAKHLMDGSDKSVSEYVLGYQIDTIVGTLFRQTMFAEYEHLCHDEVEAGGAMTITRFREIYRGLLEKYFGAQVELPEVADLEGLRIPHFYGAFYVYKYATGLSAAIALADRVADGDADSRERYLSFLKSGGSRFPLDSLATAGVDMASPDPIRRTTELFGTLVERLEKSLR